MHLAGSGSYMNILWLFKKNFSPKVLGLDPHVFGPLGSGFGSISKRYGSGSSSRSFYHQAKIVRKTLIPTVLWLLLDFLSLKTDVNDLQKVISRKSFLLASWGQWRKWQDTDTNPDPFDRGMDSGSGSTQKWNGSETLQISTGSESLP
jgi:hypothetical protein